MKMKICMLGITTILVLSVVACDKTKISTTSTSSTSPTPADRWAPTRAVFASKCEGCHGARGEGGIVKVDDLKLKVPSLREGKVLRHSDEDYADQVLKGGDGMPSFKDKLTPQEIEDLIKLIREEFQGQVLPPQK